MRFLISETQLKHCYKLGLNWQCCPQICPRASCYLPLAKSETERFGSPSLLLQFKIVFIDRHRLDKSVNGVGFGVASDFWKNNPQVLQGNSSPITTGTQATVVSVKCDVEASQLKSHYDRSNSADMSVLSEVSSIMGLKFPKYSLRD